MSMGERIEQRLTQLGMSQAELARRAGVKQPTISMLITGKSRGSAYLHKIARELQTTPEYLSGETDDAGPIESSFAASTAPSRPAAGQIAVRMLDLAYGMGGTYVDDGLVDVREEFFPTAFIREYTDAPADQLALVQGIGDSMEPTLFDSDRLLLDLSKTRILMDDRIWAFAIGEVGSIKRLRTLPAGGLEILSDNPSVPNQIAADDELHIVGQVVAAIRKF